MNALKKIVYSQAIPAIGRLCHYKNKIVNVIYYHDIVKGAGDSFQKTNVEIFKQQMLYIANNGYKTLRFDDLNDEAHLCYNSKSLVIAFDDGWASNCNEIYDFMKSLGLKYNIYLAIKEIGNNPDFLTWAQVRKMHEEGFVGFGIHTYNHVNASDISLIDPSLEFDKANEIFEQELGYTPLDFCYPYGAYTESSNRYLIENTPYMRIYTSDLMYSYTKDGRVFFGRCGIKNEESMGIFKSKLKGYFNIWSVLLKIKKWIA